MTGSAFFFHATKNHDRFWSIADIADWSIADIADWSIADIADWNKKTNKQFFFQTVFLLQAGMAGMSRLEWLE